MVFCSVCMYCPCIWVAHKSYGPELAAWGEYLAFCPRLPLPDAAAGCARCFACLSAHADNMSFGVVFIMPKGDVQALCTCLQTYVLSTDDPLLPKTA